MTGSRLKLAAALALETAASLFLVLLLYWLFMTFLYALFPSGTSVKELLQTRTDLLPSRDAAGRSPEAALKSLVRDVRFRRGNSVAWGDAREGLLLYNHDAVQTFDRSGVTISFATADYLALGSNSMVVVTRIDGRATGGPKTYRVQVEGDLRGNLSASREVKMELATAGHLARLVPGKARFRVTPGGEEAASLAVYEGEARVQGHDGIIRVPSLYGITLRRGVPAGPAVPLPVAPGVREEKLIYRYRLLPPKVRFTWNGGPGPYHFQLSRDPRFANPVLDRMVDDPELVCGTLEAGSYYWRVSRVQEGREGLFSSTGLCELKQLLKAPGLTVQFPPKSAASGPFRLAGSAEPGSRVYVNGLEVATEADGAFDHELELKAGVNLIRVEAVDPAGNASYASQVVHGAR